MKALGTKILIAIALASTITIAIIVYHYSPSNFATVMAGTLPTALTLMLFFSQRYLSDKDVWEERRQGWLKKHYYDLAKKMADPFGEHKMLIVDTNFNFLNPRPFLLRYESKNALWPATRIPEPVENQFYFSSEDVRLHISTGYRSMLKLIESAINNTKSYMELANRFLSDLNKSISKVFNNFIPNFPEQEFVMPDKEGYYPLWAVNSILIGIYNKQEGIAVTTFSTENKRMDRTKIIYGNVEVGVMPGLFPKSVEICNDLQSLIYEYKETADRLIEEKKRIEGLWLMVDNGINVIKDDLENSGIAIDGWCNVCTKTRKARELIPYD